MQTEIAMHKEIIGFKYDLIYHCMGCKRKKLSLYLSWVMTYLPPLRVGRKGVHLHTTPDPLQISQFPSTFIIVAKHLLNFQSNPAHFNNVVGLLMRLPSRLSSLWWWDQDVHRWGAAVLRHSAPKVLPVQNCWIWSGVTSGSMLGSSQTPTSLDADPTSARKSHPQLDKMGTDLCSRWVVRHHCTGHRMGRSVG